MKIMALIAAFALLTLGLDAQNEPSAKALPNRTRCRQTLSVKPWA